MIGGAGSPSEVGQPAFKFTSFLLHEFAGGFHLSPSLLLHEFAGVLAGMVSNFPISRATIMA
jgi:hypothetical protein